MASANKNQIRLQVEPGNKQKLQDIAAKFGYIQRSGPGHKNGIGSLSWLLDAIADGEVVVQKKDGK